MRLATGPLAVSSTGLHRFQDNHNILETHIAKTAKNAITNMVIVVSICLLSHIKSLLREVICLLSNGCQGHIFMLNSSEHEICLPISSKKKFYNLGSKRQPYYWHITPVICFYFFYRLNISSESLDDERALLGLPFQKKKS